MITPFILIYNVNGYTVFSFNISVIIITIVSKDIINKTQVYYNLGTV